jgi:lipid-binding SYLF domain-containing protein
MKCRFVFLLCFTLTISLSAQKDSKEEDRLKEAGTVLQEILNAPDNVPKNILDKAECVVILPSVKKFAIGIGGSAGKGAMVCRGGEKFNGHWGAPAMFRLEGMNVGLQLGGQATDFVLLVMSPKGVNTLLTTKAKLGADASAAAGPKGRDAAAATDAAMTAEVLSYSRSKGLFGGVSLEGASLRQDNDANKKIYGKEITAKEILIESKVVIPAGAMPLVAALEKASPENLSEPKPKPVASPAKSSAPAKKAPATKKK